MNQTLFTLSAPVKTYKKLQCNKCHAYCDAAYLLSSKTKALWVMCKTCGTHAVPYVDGLALPWKPSKSFIKEVGYEKAHQIAKEKEKNMNKQKEPKTNAQRVLYCDAGTRFNGVKGKQQTIVVICDSHKKVLFEKWIGDYSNNEGELIGITNCMQEFANHKPVHIFTDSKIAANWTIQGWTKEHQKRMEKGVLTARHKELIQKAHDLYKNTKSIITWLAREENLAGQYIEEEIGL